MEFLASAWMIAVALVFLGGFLLYSRRNWRREEAYMKYVNGITCDCCAPEEVERTVKKFILDNFRVNATVESIKYFSSKYSAEGGAAKSSVIHVHAVSREKSGTCADKHGAANYVSHFNVVIDNVDKELYLATSKK